MAVLSLIEFVEPKPGIIASWSISMTAEIIPPNSLLKTALVCTNHGTELFEL